MARMVKLWLGVLMGALLLLACETEPLLHVFPIRDWSGTLKPGALPELREVLISQLAAGGKLRVKAYNPQSGRDCTGKEEECAREAGSGKHHVLAKIIRPGEDCVFILQVRESKQPVVVRSSSLRFACDEDSLLEVIPRAVAELGGVWGQGDDDERMRLREMEALRHRFDQELKEQVAALEKERNELAASRKKLERQRAAELPSEAPPDTANVVMDDRIRVVGEGINPAKAEKIIKRHLKQLQHCVERHLKTDHWLPERVLLKLSVIPTGRVKQVSIEGIPKGKRGSILETCMLQAARRWLFSAWQGGKPLELHLPIFLARG